MSYASHVLPAGFHDGQQHSAVPYQQSWQHDADAEQQWHNALHAIDQPEFAAAMANQHLMQQAPQMSQQQPRTHTNPGRNQAPAMHYQGVPPHRVDLPVPGNLAPASSNPAAPTMSAAIPPSLTSTTMDARYGSYPLQTSRVDAYMQQQQQSEQAYHTYPTAAPQQMQPQQHRPAAHDLNIGPLPSHGPYPAQGGMFYPTTGDGVSPTSSTTWPGSSADNSPTIPYPAGAARPQKQQQQQQQQRPQQPLRGTAAAREKAKKRQRKETRPEPVSPPSDEEDEPESPVAERPGKSGAHRACVNCKKAKVRCIVLPGSEVCRKCQSNSTPCVIEPRRPPRNPNRREYFLAQIREKDAIIESLLKELYNPYRATPLSVKTFSETAARAEETNASIRLWRARLVDGARPTAPAPLSSPMIGDDEDEGDSSTDRGGAPIKVNKDESPLEDAAPVALFEELSISKDTESVHTAETSEHSSQGASGGENTLPRQKPSFDHRKSELLNHGLVNEDDVNTLFQIYHAKLNSFIPLLDPVLHTPREVFNRCPPLFSAICAITSRYYEHKSQIYPIAMHFAKNECSNALMHGFKSVELAQAFILLAFYSQPAKRWEEERGYVFGGLAMRMAIDLNLHVTPTTKPKTEKEEREQLNRLRLWMICFQTDLNMAAHYGKPVSLKENQIIRMSDGFYTRSEYALVGDIGLAAYNRLLRVVAVFHRDAYSDPDSKTGLNKAQDFRKLGELYDEKLDQLLEEWQIRFVDYTKFAGDPTYEFRCSLLPYAVDYCRLVICSFGFQQAFERGIQSTDREYLVKCMSAAKSVIKVMVEKLGPSQQMRYAPTGWFNFCSFASAFLIKLLRPEFSEILRKDEEKEIFTLVGRLIRVLASTDVAIDDRHVPKLWSRFLEELIAKRTRDNASKAPQTEQKAASTSMQNVTGSVAQSMEPAPQVHAQMYQQPTAVPSMSYATSPVTNGLVPGMEWTQPQQPLVGLGYVPSTNNAAPYAQPQFYDFNMTIDDDATLASMAALGDQAVFWDNVLLPGFAWPESPNSTVELPIVEAAPVQPDAHTQWYAPH